MNHAKTTLIFLGAAALALILGWEPWAARSTPVVLEDEIDKPLFAEFGSARDATSMQVVKFDEATSTADTFKVARVGGVWSIPSHQNYPADAREHLAEAATVLRDVNVLGVVSTAKSDHELYGVVAPQSAGAGQQGVGTQVTFTGAQDKVLADVVIGKEVKEQPGLRYVRRAGNDRVYKAKLNPDSFSTKFGDWIERDLLKLNQYDIRQVFLNDYSSQPIDQRRMGVLKRSEIKLAYDDEKSAWKLLEMVQYEKNQPKPDQLADDEELNSEKLNALRTALDDLEIVDVERKPKGIDVDLKVTKKFFDENLETLISLSERGFVFMPGKDDMLDFLSSEGEVICSMKDGVEYVLRFGLLREGKGGESKTGDGKSRLNRYLFVSARLNKDLIPPPKLDPLPGEKPAEEKKQPDDASPAGEGEKPAQPQPKSEDKPADAKPADPDKPKSSEEAGRELALADAEVADEQAEEPKADAPASQKDKESDPAKTDENKSDEKKADAKSAQTKPDEKKAAAPVKPEDKAAADAAKAAVEKENQRKQEEYDSKLKAAGDRVKELNKRFADWYYVISDDVYQKIHLARTDVVKQKEQKPGQGNSPADLKAIEEGGLKKPAAPSEK